MSTERQDRHRCAAGPARLPEPRRHASFVYVMVATLGLVVIACGRAEADCQRLSFGSMPRTVDWLGAAGTGYGVFDAADYVQSVIFTVTKDGGSCNYFVTATSGDGDTFTNRVLSNGQATLQFNVYTTSTRTSIIRDLPGAMAEDVILGGFTERGRQTDTRSYYFDIAPQQVVVPGKYAENLEFKLYAGDLTSNRLVDTVAVRQEARVAPAMEVSVVPPGQPFDPFSTSQSLDLGTLDFSSQRSASLDLRVRANTGFALVLKSQNRGMMRYSDRGDRSRVPYVFDISGIRIDLSHGRKVIFNGDAGAASLGGKVFPITVTVNAVHGLPTAGHYSDVVTVTGVAE